MDRQRPLVPCRSECWDCEHARIEWFERLHDADVLAAKDPIRKEQRDRELARWLAQDPPAVVPSEVP